MRRQSHEPYRARLSANGLLVFFREKGVRFIAISNNIDSQNRESGEFAPFLNIMSEWYLRDASRKVKASHKARGMSGKRLTFKAIYGYMPDPQDKEKWIIDTEAAEIVKRIFDLTIEGKGPTQIARILHDEKVERPSYYTERGNLNREIEVTNQRLRQLKARISKLQNWLKEEQESTAPPTLADYIQDILKRKAQAGKSDVSQSLYYLKDAANMLNFLTANNIMDMAGLDEKFSSMIGEQMDIWDKLKPIDRRLDTLKKHIEQADIYMRYKSKKSLTEAEQIRKSVYSILQQEQREQQPRRTQDMEH